MGHERMNGPTKCLPGINLQNDNRYLNRFPKKPRNDEPEPKPKPEAKVEAEPKPKPKPKV
jgi:hypothetical protein